MGPVWQQSCYTVLVTGNLANVTSVISCAPARAYNGGGYSAGKAYGAAVGINSTKRLMAGA